MTKEQTGFESRSDIRLHKHQVLIDTTEGSTGWQTAVIPDFSDPNGEILARTSSTPEEAKKVHGQVVTLTNQNLGKPKRLLQKLRELDFE